MRGWEEPEELTEPERGTRPNNFTVLKYARTRSVGVSALCWIAVGPD